MRIGFNAVTHGHEKFSSPLVLDNPIQTFLEMSSSLRYALTASYCDVVSTERKNKVRYIAWADCIWIADDYVAPLARIELDVTSQSVDIPFCIVNGMRTRCT